MERERKPGRPHGRTYPVLKQLRLSEQDNERLRILAQQMEESEAGVVRALIRKEARARGIKLEGAE